MLSVNISQVIQYVITESGKVADLEVCEGVSPILDKEAYSVVKLTDGKWKPGLHDNQKVRVSYTLPVNFVL